MTEVEFVGIDAAEAVRLEGEFLSHLGAASEAYEAFSLGRGWVALGYDSFAEWWGERVMPRFRVLEVKPNRELAARVIDQVREEEQDLPPLQRRTQQELADLAGVSPKTLQRQDRPEGTVSAGSDLDDPLPPEIAEKIERRIEEKAKPAEPIWSTEEYALLEQVKAGRTVVASMRGQHENLIAWAERDGKYVRIDRRTKWGNPFEMPADGDRETVIANYAEHYLPHKPSLLAEIGALRGKVLVCWCSPEPCHGDVLAEVAER